MPARYEIDPARKLVVSTATGTFTDEDLLAHSRALAADPDFDPSYRQLVDFLGVTALEVTSRAVRTLAGDSPWTSPTRRALVCNQAAIYGMVRMYQTLTEGRPPELRIFQELAAARAWLESEEPE